MREQISKFSDEVEDQLGKLQHRLKLLKDKVIVESADTRETLRAQIHTLDESIEKQSKRLKHAADDVEDWAEEKIELLNEWRKARQHDKLLDRAERSDRYAKARMELAVDALEKAERAMLQAALARADAKSADDDDDDKREND